MEKLKLLTFADCRPCPKCHSAGASVRYCSANNPQELIQVNGNLYSLNVTQEFLYRKCESCGYEWLEEVYS